jgi:hypothetical protein
VSELGDYKREIRFVYQHEPTASRAFELGVPCERKHTDEALRHSEERLKPTTITVLSVDDLDDAAGVAFRVLEANSEIHIVGETIAMVNELRPSVVLMDIKMPDSTASRRPRGGRKSGQPLGQRRPQ